MELALLLKEMANLPWELSALQLKDLGFEILLLSHLSEEPIAANKQHVPIFVRLTVTTQSQIKHQLKCPQCQAH